MGVVAERVRFGLLQWQHIFVMLVYQGSSRDHGEWVIIMMNLLNEQWRHCVFMVLVLDNTFVGCVTSINGWWIVRERNRCVYKEQNTQVYFNISALVMQWNVCDFVRWLRWPVCLVNEYADRHISSYVRCAWLLVSYCDALLMLQPQVKRRRMWSCVNLSSRFVLPKAVSSWVVEVAYAGTTLGSLPCARSLAFWPPRYK